MPNGVIITGMHRSGTSLFAHYLAKSGVEIGDTLLAPDSGNPKGYFEDENVVELHNDILKANGCHYLFNLRRLPKFRIDETFQQRAKEIINSKKSDTKNWGWKDPRTSLFLEFWQKLLPKNTKFIFLLRNPISVYDSLLRRGTDEGIAQEPVIGLKSWILYNKQMLNFYLRHPEDIMIININRFMSSEKTYRQHLKDFLETPIDDTAARIIDKSSFTEYNSLTDTLSHTLLHPILYLKAWKLYGNLLSYDNTNR